jgi:hypothetical protein
MTQEEKRAQIVTEARSWIGTPYHARARTKGAGCECGSLLMGIAVNCGLVKDEALEMFSLDCWAHWTDDKYRLRVMRHARRVLDGVAYRTTNILPGCLILTRAAGCKWFNHGAFVTKWPMIVHSVMPHVEEVDSTTHHLWAFKPIEVYDFDFSRLEQ